MNKRINSLLNKALDGSMNFHTTPTAYSREDLFLSPVKMSSKRLSEYMANQTPLIFEESRLPAFLGFDGSVEGDIFHRSGHRNFAEAGRNFYNKPVHNLLTFEWQHCAGNFEKILNGGFDQIRREIADSAAAHEGDADALEFLGALSAFVDSATDWTRKCADYALSLAGSTTNEEYRENLTKLSESLRKVPEHPAETFYEAILSLCMVYPYLPDSVGLIDRYLYPFYLKDKAAGMTDGEIRELLQEFFLLLQGRISINSDRFHRGGETHFCVGGFLENGEDGFNEFSKLIVDSLLELPTWIAQISLRWTPKTPTEVLRYMLDRERNDPNKRVAFVNDIPRIEGLTKYSGFTRHDAINYSMIGCNEIALPGGIIFGFDPLNILRSIERTFYEYRDEVVKAGTFEDFMSIYKRVLFEDLWEAESISHGLQNIRSRDINIVSSVFIDGCIERAASITQGGASKYTAVGDLIGIPNVIDSLAITKQFVYDEKLVCMDELCDALAADWVGYEDLRRSILREGDFFGNDDDTSNGVARLFTDALDEWNNDTNYMKKPWIFGNLIGYNEHHKFFGSATKATPDGRHSGEALTFGIGQINGKDRSGLIALLNSVAKCDPHSILTGPSVTNVMLDEKLMRDDAQFEKVVKLFETYFRIGGTHFQLTYVSRKDLLNAKVDPDRYKSLRVRVSGFSEYFVTLNTALQDELIARTPHDE